MKKGFKLVRIREGSYISLFLLDFVVYKENKLVTPRPSCGPLCVFETKESAMSFCDNVHRCSPNPIVVYECDYIPSTHNKVWDLFGEVEQWRLPKGTVLADGVILRRRVC